MRSIHFVIAFTLIAASCYFHFMKGKKEALHALNERLSSMVQERVDAIQIREELELRLASQNDPAWIEMVLMQKVGVVPEGFLKVHFQK
jgi:hypothetical protein